LLDGEEVLAFQGTILRQVGAVDSIADSVKTISGTEGLRAQVLGDLGIHGATELTERLNGVLLANFHNNTRSGCHVL